MKKKKILVFAGIALLIIIGVVTVFITKEKTPQQPEEQDVARRRISEPVNVISISQRPYVNILPLPDNQHLTIQVISLNKDASSVNYALEYQAGTSLRGAEGEINLETLPSTEEIFLGSCSAGGACTYDKDITGGNLLLTFLGSESYAVKTNWRYIENTDKSDSVASWDAKFKLQSPVFVTTRYSIVFNSPGVPEGIQEALSEKDSVSIVADHYALSTSSEISGKGKATIRLFEDIPTATIVGYDGTKWVAFDTTVKDKEASAEVELMELYTAVN